MAQKESAQNDMISYKKAMSQNLIKEAELSRMIAVTLILNGTLKPDNKICAYESDNTPGSFAVQFRGAIKKLRDAGCGYTEDELKKANAPESLKDSLDYRKCVGSKWWNAAVAKRFAAVYLIHNTAIHVDKAVTTLAAQAVNNTVGSFSVMINKTLSNLRAAKCGYTPAKYQENIASAATPGGSGAASTGRGRKRFKDVQVSTGPSDDGEEEEIPTPSKKKKFAEAKTKTMEKSGGQSKINFSDMKGKKLDFDGALTISKSVCMSEFKNEKVNDGTKAVSLLEVAMLAREE